MKTIRTTFLCFLHRTYWIHVDIILRRHATLGETVHRLAILTPQRAVANMIMTQNSNNMSSNHVIVPDHVDAKIALINGTQINATQLDSNCCSKNICNYFWRLWSRSQIYPEGCTRASWLYPVNEEESRTQMLALTCNAREHALSWEAGVAHICLHTCESRYARQRPASGTEAYQAKHQNYWETVDYLGDISLLSKI